MLLFFDVCFVFLCVCFACCLFFCFVVFFVGGFGVVVCFFIAVLCLIIIVVVFGGFWGLLGLFVLLGFFGGFFGGGLVGGFVLFVCLFLIVRFYCLTCLFNKMLFPVSRDVPTQMFGFNVIVYSWERDVAQR